MSKKIALAFVDAINAHDVDKIIPLMVDSHVFIDAYGSIESKKEMQQGWPDYFVWFPDYLIEIDEVLESGNTVALFGHAGGTYYGKTTFDNKHYWRIPAAWRIIVEGEKVAVWQVYADSKIPFDIMNEVDKARVESKKP